MASADILTGAQQPFAEYPQQWVDFAEFMQFCWETVRLENGGSPNVHGTADFMYDCLYGSEACPLTPENMWPPSRETFVRDMRIAMLQGHIFRGALYPGAGETVAKMSEVGPVLFWTTGDMFGGVDGEGRSLPGSLEQYIRVTSSGLLRVQDRLDGQAHPFNVAGSENKIALLPRCFAWLAERGVTDVVVLEDRLDNLQEVRRFATEHAGSVPNLHLAWLRQGRHGNTGTEAPASIHSVASIAQFPDLLASLQLEHPGFLSDYDGVFSDDARRQYLQQLSVWHMLYEKGWVSGSYEQAAA